MMCPRVLVVSSTDFSQFSMTEASNFFCGRIDHMIDLRQLLEVLASRMPWQEIEASPASRFAHRIGHLGKDQRIGRCFLKSEIGGKIHAVL
jgi:hypothetical protein